MKRTIAFICFCVCAAFHPKAQDSIPTKDTILYQSTHYGFFGGTNYDQIRLSGVSYVTPDYANIYAGGYK